MENLYGEFVRCIMIIGLKNCVRGAFFTLSAIKYRNQ